VSTTEPSAVDELIAIMARLRAPGGCPWDAEQTHESLIKYLVEETYELIDAIESGNRDDMIEELGDVLYQVLFHADIASTTPEENFTIQDVAAHMSAKMISRHPHVFGDRTADTAEDVMEFWDDLKKAEKPGRTSTLDGIPQSMPALALADKLLGKADGVGLPPQHLPDAPLWENEDEIGSVMLSIVSSAKAQGFDAERALRIRLRELQEDIREAE
jgi:XTP/dITP diphosphohydrolase